MDWASLYPAYAVKKLAEEEDKNAITVDESRASDEAGLQDQREARATVQDVEIADIGCGFGGLLFALATKFPETLSLGMIFGHYVAHHLLYHTAY